MGTDNGKMVCFVKQWPPVNFRYASLATKLKRRCNMSVWANCGLMHRNLNLACRENALAIVRCV